MATRTGAPYVHFEAWYCPETEGGCGVLQSVVEDTDGAPLPMDDGWRLDNPTANRPVYRCPNCNHEPLAHVSVTSADNIPEA